MSPENFATVVQPYFENAFPNADATLIAAASDLAQTRSVTLVDAARQSAFLFTDDIEIVPESWEKVVATERINDLLIAVAAHIETWEWTV